MTRFGLAVAAYLVPTFALGFVWHLVAFEDYYRALAMYRADIIVPLGFLSMAVQAVIFALLYERCFAERSGSWLARGLAYAALGAILSWSYTTLAVAAKNVMASVPDYILIETAFTLAQWIIVGPLTALVFERWRERGTASA
ncbi:MAG: hypothetical protein J0I45_10845 [Bosea sp.]|nr:hypothetical protein [Bosea sp. (in: a-proteobacteria)]